MGLQVKLKVSSFTVYFACVFDVESVNVVWRADGSLANMIEGAQDGEMGSSVGVDQSLFYLRQILLGVAHLRSLYVLHLNINSLCFFFPPTIPSSSLPVPSFLSFSLHVSTFLSLLSLFFICLPFSHSLPHLPFLSLLPLTSSISLHTGENILILEGGRRLKLTNFEKALYFEDVSRPGMLPLTGVAPHFAAPEVRNLLNNPVQSNSTSPTLFTYM